MVNVTPSPIGQYLRALLGGTDFLADDQSPPIPALRQPEPQAEQNPSQPEVPKAEFNTKEIIDQNTLRAMQQPRNSEQQQRQIQLQDSSDPAYWQSIGYGQQIAALKALNELASNGEKGNAMRALTNSLANAAREQAGAAGIDVSPYGSDVTAYDVNQQLQSQQARDILEGMHGKYSQTSDQYYQDAYLKNVMAGYSPRQARKFASNAARQYQAERVSYLDNLYNHYGREGYVTTPEGNQIIGQLAMENPMLANFYAQLYPNAKEAYKRQNELADNALAQRNALAQLGLSHQYGQENMWLQALLNDYLNNNNAIRSRDTYSANKEVDKQNEIDKENRAFDLTPRVIEQQIGIINKYLPEADRAPAINKLFGLAQGKNDTQNKDKTPEYLNNLLSRITAQRKALTEPYKDNFDGIPPEVQAQIAQLDEDYRITQEAIMGITGINQQTGIQEYTGDEATDSQTLEQLKKLANGDSAKFKEYVSKWLDESGVTPRAKEQLLKKLRTPHN